MAKQNKKKTKRWGQLGMFEFQYKCMLYTENEGKTHNKKHRHTQVLVKKQHLKKYLMW